MRRVDAVTGIITTVAGSGTEGDSGDGGLATLANLRGPNRMTLDPDGNLLVVDNPACRIRRVDELTGIITTRAGTGTPGFSGDGGPATAARLWAPSDVKVDPFGNLLIADTSNYRVRKIDGVTGLMSTIVGSGTSSDRGGSFAGDGGPATAARCDQITAIDFDLAGNLLVDDRGNHRIRRVDAVTGVITTIVGTGTTGLGGGGFGGDGGPALLARLNAPRYFAVDSQGNLLIADTYNDRIRKVSAATTCGNGIVDPGEPCDDGGANGSAGNCCTLGCILMPDTNGDMVCDAQDTGTSCGDGDLDPGEVCDDGPDNGTFASCCSRECSPIPDSDGDGSCDTMDSCSNLGGGQDFLGSTPRPRLQLRRINSDPTPGDDQLRFKGDFILRGQESFAALNPQANGARFVLESGSGGVRLDANLPSGAYDASGRRGWTLTGSGKTWVYLDGNIPPLAGIQSVVVRDRRRKGAGRVQVDIVGARGTIPVVVGDEPLRATVVLGTQVQAIAGLCGQIAYAPGECGFNASGGSLTCKK